MIPRRFEGPLFAAIMALLMVTVMSFVATAVNVGFSSSFITRWLSALLLMYPIAVACVLLFRPLAARLVRWLVRPE